jgi:alkylhydroperoxidase/carboxymuconolactone decarboxylase family protein
MERRSTGSHVARPIRRLCETYKKTDKGALMGEYYEKKDLEDFGNIGEYAPELGEKYFDYYGEVMKGGKLSEREKALIALVVATTQKCPYCIDAYTNQCLSLGIPREEMMEAVHVGAAMVAGIVLAHSTQMRKIIKKKEM